MTGAARVIVTLTLVALYAYLIPRAGFFTTTGLFLLGHMWLLGIRRPMVLIGVTAGTSIVLFLVFRAFLGVPLPRGAFI
jgi:hypothetical protein